MKRSTWTVAITVALASKAQAAPQPLSSEALDRAVATVVVADESSVDLQVRREVDLTDSAQSGTRALNVVNGASADVGNALNVLTGTSGITTQRNFISQENSAVARVTSIDRVGMNRHTSTAWQSRVDAGASLNSIDQQILRSQSSHSTVDTYNANVPAYNPLQNLTLTIGTPSMPPVTIPSFGFNVTEPDSGISVGASIGPFTFKAPQLVLGTVSLSGADIVMHGGYLDLGALDLGTASFHGCLGDACIGFDKDLGSVDMPRINFGGDLRIAGGNPFKDVQINAGGGFSLAGSGHIQADLGHVSLSANVSLNFPDLSTSLDFDVFGQHVSHDFNVGIPSISASIDLIDADVGAAYSADFNGTLCLSIVTTRCDGLQHREHSDETHIDITTTTASSTQWSQSSSSTSGSETLMSGARMTGAEADLISMSEGDAKLDTESVVHLDAGAQRGLEAFNAVNAAGAMIGNALNVAAPPAVGTSMSQNNTFTQYQTRPRGH
jgi:hypothetical protein